MLASVCRPHGPGPRAPEGVTLTVTDSGYINKEKFLEYGVVFIRFLKSKNLLNRPHIVLMDNHCTHVFNKDFQELM